jgi:catechol 2,3-dioxygenase-like lactoylglutathione lyase family enzyme
MSLISPIKTVVQVVSSLDHSRRLYENALGLTCVGEQAVALDAVSEIWRVTGGEFRIARFARAGEDFGCIDVVENKFASSRIRDPQRSFDFGVMTLNYRTNNLEAAIDKLRSCGAEPTTEILEYNIGKPIREIMAITDTGERLTIIEVGGTDAEMPVFNEAIATVGLVTPRMSESKRFYEQAFGMTLSIAFQAEGSPFDRLLGVDDLRKLDFATLTSDGIWTGKVELLELDVGLNPANTNELADFAHTGYTFVTFLADDLDAVAASCRAVAAEIIVEPKIFNRPFHAGHRAMIVRALGGEYLEVIER